MATITLIKNANGTAYRAQIRRFKNGKLVYSEARTFPKRAWARSWAATREAALTPAEISRHRHRLITVGDLLHWYETDYCQQSGRTKQADIRRLQSYALADLTLHGLTSETLINHVRDRLRQAKPQTVHNDLIWLRNVFKAAYPAWGIKADTVEIDVATHFCRANGMVSKAASRKRRPTADEITRLRQHFKRKAGSIPMADILDFAITSARRQAEITSLRWSDNDDKHQTGMVRDLKHPRKKAGNHKRFKYTPEAWAIVQRQPRTSEFIFPYNPKTIGALFARACRLLGIQDLRFHDLRHEATSRLFEAGYSIVEVQLFTLHDSWTVLSRYANLRPENVVIR